MLGQKEILDRIESGQIIVDPFEPKHVGPNSLDLRLGEWHARQKRAAEHHVINITDPIDPSAIWKEPKRIPNGILILAPGELVLAHTMERVGTYGNIVGELSSRSSAMRMGIAVCVDAGLGDIGYDSRWTLEIYNHTKVSLAIPVGARICQMKFHEVLGAGHTYQEKGGTYGSKDNWTPNDMLPRSSLF